MGLITTNKDTSSPEVTFLNLTIVLFLSSWSRSMHSVHRLSPPETRLCDAPDVESIEILGASAALGTACAGQSANQRGDNLTCKNLSQIRHILQSHKTA